MSREGADGRDAAASSDAAPAATGLAVLVDVADPDWERLDLGEAPEALAQRCLDAAARGAGLPGDLATEIGVTLTDDAAVQELNARWREKDRPTNVLSFPIRDLQPGEPPGPMLGDLVLARETIEREAAAEAKTVRDHVAHLLVHGFLHCLGHDHDTGERADRMEALERRILADLGISDPYAFTEPEQERVGI